MGRLFLLFDIASQRLDIVFKGPNALLRDAAEGAGHLAAEGLFDRDIARLLELVELHAQIARRGTRLLA